MWGSALQVPETLSNLIWLNSDQFMRCKSIALETIRSIKSSHPFMFKNKTLAQFFFTGKIFTPLMVNLVFLALLSTWDQSGKSQSFLSLKTRTVMCMEDKGISKSLSSYQILGAIQLLQRSFKASHKGMWMKWVKPVYLRTGLLILGTLSLDDSETTESSWMLLEAKDSYEI